eukprot:TRINITY_DN25587_c0_g1_i2.p1 TRINITY_DN25587_c0_g1~~TRINITY_DN25587_c0_g1_i2.p1  ORF type:complete len:487 (+),score=110.27 TRINITY_DN25587_c0_g1_i2:106-1461(+)
MLRVLLVLRLALTAGGQGPNDAVLSLPQIGDLKNKHFAGFAQVNSTTERELFYWFVEASTGNKPGVTHNIIWMNGGPGSSSIMGLLAEKIGPVAMDAATGQLAENMHAWTRNSNVLIIDNPVGSGYSFTGKDSYVKTEEEMRKDYYTALQVFFAKHEEYRSNPLWVTGESYGGKYVPNVAYEIHLRGELPLKGVIIGNGVYSGKLQYPTVPEFAYAMGLVDEHMKSKAEARFNKCLQLIDAGKLSEAANFCEDTVRWLYASNETAGGVFYYDVGLDDAGFIDDLTAKLGEYLNSPATREALHVGNRSWRQADEKGPVSDSLLPDFVTEQGMRVMEKLLDADKGYRVVTYNGVRDGSLCNHLGNLLAMKALQWSGTAGFEAAETVPWRPWNTLAGYKRSYGVLTYITLRNTGHLVPMIKPEIAEFMIEEIMKDEGFVSSPLGAAGFSSEILV